MTFFAFQKTSSNRQNQVSENKNMAPNYPALPDSPSVSIKSSTKKSKANKKPPSSPLLTISDIPDIEDYEKYEYEVRKAATGTGIFSSLFTLAIVKHYNPNVLY